MKIMILVYSNKLLQKKNNSKIEENQLRIRNVVACQPIHTWLSVCRAKSYIFTVFKNSTPNIIELKLKINYLFRIHEEKKRLL